MPALDLRRFLSAAFVEGVVGANDMVVAQRGSGANMSVDISSGQALIQGDAITNQGLYYAYNDAVFNLSGFSAANATNPRIDRVTLRVRDQFHGDAANDISFQIVTGTATAGATLVNLTGAATVPASSLLLANVLIPATATTITTANIDTTVRTGYGWQTYTPTLSASGGGSPTLGNATVTARRAQIGKTVESTTRIVLGSSTSFGTGNLQIALPVAAAGAAGDRLGYGDLIDASTNNGVACTAVLITSTVLSLVVTPTYLGTRTFVSGSGGVPWTWATSDEVAYTLSYEAA